MLLKKFIISVSFLSVLLCSCSGGSKQFVVEGKVTDAAGCTLFMEEVGTGNVVSLDSVVLNESGEFRFVHDGSYFPMFYRLRLNGDAISFSADSITHLIIKASGHNFFTGYELVESDQANRQIQDIAYKRYNTDCRIDSLVSLYATGLIGPDSLNNMVGEIAAQFKKEMTTRYIYVDPKSPASYFALFQKKNGVMYFDAEDKMDSRAFAAVATSFDAFYPNAPYTPFLKDIALKSIKTTRQKEALKEHLRQLETIAPIAFPEIELQNSHGEKVSLTKVAERNRRTLICITAYSGNWSPALVRTLRDMYSKKDTYNLEIYEVSEDKDIYYWRNASRTLPWICVFDPDNSVVGKYNLKQLPSFFLIKDGVLHILSSPEEALL
ncbi:Uncharacterised protein [Porphyromonas macacae]|uniref:Alkyl hydroperoxide reductase subunit C/ Thiol specific antioxidant domain-containing protein n=1 Tax=Porphyromonas macacae TaxID=28115 RepID=A0A379DH67_9PORP|nr:Uncharacterised protein [Porphyromonas macacae]